MKHRPLLAGLFGAAVLATGAISWAVATRSDMFAESKAPAPAYQEADSLLRKGIQQDRNHDHAGAAHSYARVLELQPQNKYAWYDLGYAAEEVGNTDDARRAYERALTIDPAFSPALYNEALLLKKSKPDQAMALLERAMTADPKSAATAHYHIGLIWSRKGRDRQAVTEFRQAVAINPSLLSEVPRTYRESLSKH
ncbi:tetratricopeptide repeat protein [Streptomyces sp. NPDC059688]|uniref:Tetratricopeptide repeat protein n=1 Tax=Streptomyces albidocamelliae TaxID=2981135 RepID=A0ABY6ET10_9ACTN|nr:tetratricopeptide repeat protein [Streptomyces sp. HUAS 14-6]UXY37539.1 tetratricopeptide repeat protein [Streptomyces sp. HUAS 14-6]